MVKDGQQWSTIVNKKEKELKKEDFKDMFHARRSNKDLNGICIQKNSRKLKVEREYWERRGKWEIYLSFSNNAHQRDSCEYKLRLDS